MAIRNAIPGGRDLRIPGTNPGTGAGKRAYATAMPNLAPFSGVEVVGHWRAIWARLPNNYSGSFATLILGWDAANTASFSGSADCSLRIPQSGYTTVTNARLRPRINYISGSGNPAYSGGSGGSTATANEGDWPATLSQLPLASTVPVASDAVLIIDGVRNIGSNASPIWRNFISVCRAGGTPETYVAATQTAANWLSNTTGRLLHQIFVAQSTGTTRTAVDTVLEHAALVRGDFPWETGINPSAGATGVGRPHHDAIAALAGSGANPFLTYESLINQMNAGTLPYSNLLPERGQGKASLDYWYKLTDLATGLVNSGSVASVTLVPTDGGSANASGLVDNVAISPLHWQGGAPSIIEPSLKIVGGGGTKSETFTGLYTGATTAMQRRWLLTGTATPVPGFDWADIASLVSGTWSFTEAPPLGNLDLEVRDKNNTALTATSSDWLIGTVACHGHGQSSMDQATKGQDDGTAAHGTNHIGEVVATGAQGMMIRILEPDAGSVGTYAKPTVVPVRMRSGETPGVGQGAVATLNAWNAINPGHPLILASVAIGGTNMGDWANNATADGHASFKFMGDIGVLPDAISGNNSGVIELMAQALRRYVDIHTFMWTPGISDIAGTPGSPDTYANATAGSRLKYRMGVDERFSNSPNAPWLIFPVWRVAREPGEASGSPTKRQRHLEWIAELGPRGIRGPCWLDPVMVGSVGHSANRTLANKIAGQPIDDNRIGQAKLGFGVGLSLAWSFNRKVKAHGPRAFMPYSNDGRATVRIPLARQVRTLNGAPLSQRDFWVSLNNGVTWVRGANVAGDPPQELANVASPQFTVALAANGTEAVLTPADGGTAWAAAGDNLKVDYGWAFPYHFVDTGDEELAENLLHRLLYDNLTYRGNTNVSGPQAGNPLQGTSTSLAGSGLAVATIAPGARVAKLVAMEKFAGARTVPVRMRIKATGQTVTKNLPITATAG